MRFFVAILAVLAGVKVYAHDQTNQTLLKSAVITAYRSHAISACQNTAATQPSSQHVTRWRSPADITVSLGEPRRTTTLWSDIANQFGANSNSVFLVLTPPGAQTILQCNYDTASGRAAIRVNRDTGI